MTNYDASPMMADAPISIEEVEALMQAEGRPILKDSRKIMHVLRRVQVAIIAYRQQIRSLNNDIQTMRTQSERAGAATTLHPRDAVRYLSPQQLSELVEGHLREQLQSAERAMGDARKARSNANSELAKVRFAVLSIMEDASLPIEIRQRFQGALRSLPEDAPRSSSPAPVPAESASQPGRRVEDLGDLFD